MDDEVFPKHFYVQGPKPKGLGMHPSLAPGYLVAYTVQCIPYSFLCNTSAHCLIQGPHQGLMRFFT